MPHPFKTSDVFDEGPPYTVEHYERWRVLDTKGNVVDDDYDTEEAAVELANDWNSEDEYE